MGRRKREGITTDPRFKIKAYSVGMGIGHDNEQLAMEYADALTRARLAGAGAFKEAYRQIIPILQRETVPSFLWAGYKAFINEVVNKVVRRKLASLDEVVEKWTDMGLDSSILSMCGESVCQIVVKEAPVPAETSKP